MPRFAKDATMFVSVKDMYGAMNGSESREMVRHLIDGGYIKKDHWPKLAGTTKDVLANTDAVYDQMGFAAKKQLVRRLRKEEYIDADGVDVWYEAADERC